MKSEGANSEGKLQTELCLTGVRPQILDRLFDMGLPLPPEISRLFPDRRADQVNITKLPAPSMGALSDRLRRSGN